MASGSSGNCVYVGSDNTHLLIDTGITYRRIEASLHDLGLVPDDIDAILITHEHTDHIKGLEMTARKTDAPVYASPGTVGELKSMFDSRQIDPDRYHTIQENQLLRIGDLRICPFLVSHDAAEPLAFRIEQTACSSPADERADQSEVIRSCAAVCTDLGCYDDDTIIHLQNLDVIMLEANHDVRMLQAGPYPYQLKQRILSERGHLSNEAAGRLLCQILHDKMKHILLGHLSRQNNLPELAYEAVRLEITMGDNPYDGSDFPISVASRDVPSELINI